MPTESELVQAVRTHTNTLLRAVAAAKGWYAETLRRAMAAHDEGVQAAEARQAEAHSSAAAVYTRETAAAEALYATAHVAVSETYTRELADADARHAKDHAVMVKTYTQETADAEARHVATHATATETYTREMSDAAARAAARTQSNEARRDETLAAVARTYDQIVRDEIARASEEASATRLAPIAWKTYTDWSSHLWDPGDPAWSQVVEGDLWKAYRAGDHPAANPTHPYWQPPLTPRDANGIPEFLRIGTLAEQSAWHQLTHPALVPFPGDRPLIFQANGPARETAVAAMQSTILRLLAAFPQGKLQITCFDPVGRGKNFAPFMFLADYDPRLVTAQAWTELRQIEEQLAILTENMDTVIQTYLRNQYPSLAVYNEQAGEVQEPYRLLVVFDFPPDLSEAAARRLLSIARSGPPCGIFTLMLADPERPPSRNVSLTDLAANAIVVEASADNHFVLHDDDGVLNRCALTLDTPPDLRLSEQFDATIFGRVLMSVGAGVASARKVEVPFDRMYDLFRKRQSRLNKADARSPIPVFLENEETWWAGNAERGLIVPLGREGARDVQLLDLGGGDAHHVLIAGRIGSGKSVLFEEMIVNIAMLYSPADVQLYLIDLKEGVTFKTFATHRLPHARVVAIKSEREYAMSVLNDLNAELERRGDRFRAVGAQNLAEYHKNIGSPEFAHLGYARLPRIVLMVDEFQEFFTSTDRIATDAGLILDRLVRQGRSNGINVILGSQTLAGSYMFAQSTMRQMGVRIALMCAEADSRVILAEDNPEARQLTRPGQAIYNAENGLKGGNHRFQVAWLPDEERDDYLKRVRAKADAAAFMASPIIFEGDAHADLGDNKLLTAAMRGERIAEKRPAIRAWLGEPIAIEDPVSVPFRRDQGRNLVMVGQNDTAILGMMATALLSVAAQIPPVSDVHQLYLLDFSASDTDEAEYLPALVDLLPHRTLVGRRKQLPAIIAEAHAEVVRRVAEDITNASPRFLFFQSLHRARDLRYEEARRAPAYSSRNPAVAPRVLAPPAPERADHAPTEGNNGNKTPPFGAPAFNLPVWQSAAAPVQAMPAVASATALSPLDTVQQLATILREGPTVGIFTIASCDTVTNLSQIFDRQTVDEFSMRVALQMPSGDSQKLIAMQGAGDLGPLRALFLDEGENRLKKFRPYAPPSLEWLAEMGASMGKPSP